MRKLLVIVGVLFCGGCLTGGPQLCKVVDSTDFHPIENAMVRVQPWTPFHPFWLKPGSGLTDGNGEVTLQLPGPNDHWFFHSSVKAKGYKKVKPDKVEDPNHVLHVSPETRHVFFMKRDAARDAR